MSTILQRKRPCMSASSVEEINELLYEHRRALFSEIPHLVRYTLLQQLCEKEVSRTFVLQSSCVSQTVAHTYQATCRLLFLLSEKGLDADIIAMLHRGKRYHDELDVTPEAFRHSFFVLARSILFWLKHIARKDFTCELEEAWGMLFFTMAKEIGIQGVSSTLSEYERGYLQYRQINPLVKNEQAKMLFEAMLDVERKRQPWYKMHLGLLFMLAIIDPNCVQVVSRNKPNCMVTLLARWFWICRYSIKNMRLKKITSRITVKTNRNIKVQPDSGML